MPFDALPNYEIDTQKQSDLAVLRRVVDGLSQPDSWTTGVFHQGSRHCAIGWLQNFTSDRHIQRIAAVYLMPVLPWRMRWFGQKDRPTDAIIRFNDRATHERVLALFERAIRRAERRSEWI